MKTGWIIRWLEKAGTLAEATPLTPIDASYGAAWWGQPAVASQRDATPAATYQPRKHENLLLAGQLAY